MNVICIATDTISMNQQVVDDETLVSAGGIFELRFFSPNGSQGDGNLVLVDDKNMSISYTEINLVSNNNTIIVLTDKGNLDLRDQNELNESVLLWESFNHPSDALLPRMMKIGLNTRIAEQIVVTSWKDKKNPSLGSFSTAVVDPDELLQVLIFWNLRSFIGVPSMTKDFHNGFQLFMDNYGEELFFLMLYLISVPTLIYFDSYGSIIQMDRDVEENKWLKVQVVPKSQCDLYSTCGPFGTQFQCEEMITSPNSNNERKRGDVFLSISGMKLPDFSYYLLTWDKMECENSCLKNCSCLAYAYVDGIGSMIWGKELIDLQEYARGGEQLYIRLTHSQLDKRRMLTGAHIAIIVSAIFGLILIVCTIYVLKIRKKSIGSLVPFCIASKHSSATNLLHNSFNQGNSSKLPVFSFKCIETGILADGQEVAIKRLWRSSGQGIKEFKNEVTLIFGLQHRNLIKLMGFCIHGEEKLLIYEYMSNRSLDIFILGSSSNDKAALSWNQRYSIIEGIARGLLNLHRDSRLQIIHRDLTTSNILLDKDVNPKISDFGMARVYGGNQTIANTNRIAGIFSEKSNAFSFGVILLEIISSKRNNNYCKILKFLDPNVFVSLETPIQVVRCIIVNSTIISMLCNDTVLPSPKRPTHSSRGSDDPNISPCSRNSISISNVQGRQLQFIY
ncbi:hypothetical protein R3W88_024587 [Solanum pinnatisectum]|uniref:non-specific serine/threonine protein kinase n=1 Tax=Solanum pinnatisectum TaxID=50273 RepID=A0AAV9M407_9SOLN|nr:hypothetical protein R3W88_024587 [Solanum pinnatisectum]